MVQENQELSDMITKEKKSFPKTVGSALKKTGKAVYQTFAQALDADLFLAGAIASNYYYDNVTILEFVCWGAAIKQYLWGWIAYTGVKSLIAKHENITLDELREKFGTRNSGPCLHFGSKYAIREYERDLEKRANEFLKGVE